MKSKLQKWVKLLNKIANDPTTLEKGEGLDRLIDLGGDIAADAYDYLHAPMMLVGDDGRTEGWTDYSALESDPS